MNWADCSNLPGYSYCLPVRIDRVNVLRADHDSSRLNLSRRLKKIRGNEWENVPDDASDEELDEVPDENGTTALAVETEVCSWFWPRFALDPPRVHFECLVRTTSDIENDLCYDYRLTREALLMNDVELLPSSMVRSFWKRQTLHQKPASFE